MSRSSKAFTEIDCEVTSFTEKGLGLARGALSSGQIVSVEVFGTMPGDHVRVALLSKSAGVHGSFLREIIKPAPDRVKAPCSHFGDCGGCRWQHLSYSHQLSRKDDFVKKQFASLIRDFPDLAAAAVFHPILPAENPWQYRNKMEFSFSENASGDQFLGLVKSCGKGRVVNLEECHLTSSWFTKALGAVRQWWSNSKLEAYNMPRDKGSLRTLTVREGIRTGDRMVVLAISGNPDSPVSSNQLDSLVEILRRRIELKDKPLTVCLRLHMAVKGRPTEFIEKILYGPGYIREQLLIAKDIATEKKDITFNISPSAFFQPNTKQAEHLYAAALRLGKISKEDVVYDLYCGTGTFSLFAATVAKAVVGIELNADAVKDAQSNAKKNGLTNATFFAGDTGIILQELGTTASLPRPDIVVVDPPRPGLDDRAIEEILSIAPKTIVYISCNPISQAQNLRVLLSRGYRLTDVQPVDQFPQTVHVENIAILTRAISNEAGL